MEWKAEYQGQVITTKINGLKVRVDTSTEECGYWSQYPEMKEFIVQKVATKEFIEEKVVIEKPKKVTKKKGV